jgi:hypothetical protein
MISLRNSSIRKPQRSDYATIEDFCRTFDDGMSKLYQLSFLLTADHRKAEQCFVAGLEESATSNRVFKEWASSWAKRSIIQNAVRELKPHPPVNRRASSLALHFDGDLPEESRHSKLDRILGLADFDRFVFVISVLEHYSDHDCAVLLHCSPQQVGEARVRGLEELSNPFLMAAQGSSQ